MSQTTDRQTTDRCLWRRA